MRKLSDHDMTVTAHLYARSSSLSSPGIADHLDPQGGPVSGPLEHLAVLHPPPGLHQVGEARLEAPGQVDDDQLVPGAGGQAGEGSPGLGCQLGHHLPEEDRAVGPLLGEVGGGDHLPALSCQLGHQRAPGGPQAEAGGLGVPEGGDREGVAGEGDGVGGGGRGSMLRDAVVGLQDPGHQGAQGTVRGDDVELVGLLDVDGEVGDGLVPGVQLLLGLVVTHDECDLGSDTLSSTWLFGQGGVSGPIDQLSVTRAS